MTMSYSEDRVTDVTAQCNCNNAGATNCTHRRGDSEDVCAMATVASMVKRYCNLTICWVKYSCTCASVLPAVLLLLFIFRV